MANKRNPVSLEGIQGALGAAEPISQEFVDASNIASRNGKSVTTSGHVIYKLVDTTKKGNYELDLIDDVKARDGMGNERIRVLRGVQSIWQKDQKDIPPEYIKNNRRKLTFQRGNAIVPKTDHQVIEFMDLFNGNVDNPNPVMARNTKVFKWNPEKQAEEQLKKEEKELEAIFAAKDATDAALRKHASYLGISFVDGLGEPLTPSGLRAAYIRFAKNNSETFMDSLNKRDVEVTYLVKRALQDGKIDTGRGNHSIYWADGGLIGKLPVSQTAIQYLVSLAMNHSDEGQDFLENLKQRVL
jgi:hypothetical protein